MRQRTRFIFCLIRSKTSCITAQLSSIKSLRSVYFSSCFFGHEADRFFCVFHVSPVQELWRWFAHSLWKKSFAFFLVEKNTKACRKLLLWPRKPEKSQKKRANRCATVVEHPEHRNMMKNCEMPIKVNERNAVIVMKSIFPPFVRTWWGPSTPTLFASILVFLSGQVFLYCFYNLSGESDVRLKSKSQNQNALEVKKPSNGWSSWLLHCEPQQVKSQKALSLRLASERSYMIFY